MPRCKPIFSLRMLRHSKGGRRQSRMISATVARKLAAKWGYSATAFKAFTNEACSLDWAILPEPLYRYQGTQRKTQFAIRAEKR